MLKISRENYWTISEIDRAFSNFSRNLIGRQVTELNWAVEDHNFIFGGLEFRRIGNFSC